MKMQFWTFNTATAKSRKCIIYPAGKNQQQSFQTVLAVHEIRFSFSNFLNYIIQGTLQKTACRVSNKRAFFFLEKSDLSFLKSRRDFTINSSGKRFIKKSFLKF